MRRTLLWAATGLVSGAVVLGLLAPVLFLVDVRLQDDGALATPGYVVAAAIIGALWGGVAGLGAGLVCALVTGVAERVREPGRRHDAVVAATVTAIGAAPIGASMFLGEDDVGAWDVFAWVVAPVVVSAGVALLLGGWVWDRTHDAGPAGGPLGAAAAER